VLARRRLLAAVLTAVAVAAGLRAVEPPPAPTAPLLVAARDLPPGEVLGAEDLQTLPVDPGVPPSGVVPLEEALGRTLAAPVRRGEPVTDVRLVSAGLLATTPGLAAVPLRIPDPGVVGLLSVGDVVDVLATPPRGGTAETVAADVTVLALPAGADAEAPPMGGGAPPGRLVVLGADAVTARELSGASVTAYLTVVWSG
jgi:Flp pilus assembly protein CpaB